MDWTKIQSDYVNHGMSLRALARKYGVSYSTVQARAAREQWEILRLGDDSISTEVLQKLESVTRLLLERIHRAAEELELREIVTRTKEKTQDGEVTTERRYFEPAGKVDPKELKVLTSALKDVRDVLMVRPALDVREQEAKIRNLERQFAQAGETAVTVELAGDTAEFAL